MEIKLKIDYEGEPYLVLLSEKSAISPSLSSDTLELFIRQARRRGIVIKNESSLETANGYASIRLGGEALKVKL